MNPMPIPTCNAGEKVPLVTTPISWPAASKILFPALGLLREALTKSLNEVVVLQGQVKEAQAERDNALAKLKAAQESLTVADVFNEKQCYRIEFLNGKIEGLESAIRNLSAKE